MPCKCEIQEAPLEHQPANNHNSNAGFLAAEEAHKSEDEPFVMPSGDFGFGIGFGTYDTILEPQDVLYLVADAKNSAQAAESSGAKDAFYARFGYIAHAAFSDISLQTHIDLGWKSMEQDKTDVATIQNARVHVENMQRQRQIRQLVKKVTQLDHEFVSHPHKVAATPALEEPLGSNEAPPSPPSPPAKVRPAPPRKKLGFGSKFAPASPQQASASRHRRRSSHQGTNSTSTSSINSKRHHRDFSGSKPLTKSAASVQSPAEATLAQEAPHVVPSQPYLLEGGLPEDDGGATDPADMDIGTGCSSTTSFMSAPAGAVDAAGAADTVADSSDAGIATSRASPAECGFTDSILGSSMQMPRPSSTTSMCHVPAGSIEPKQSSSSSNSSSSMRRLEKARPSQLSVTQLPTMVASIIQLAPEPSAHNMHLLSEDQHTKQDYNQPHLYRQQEVQHGYVPVHQRTISGSTISAAQLSESQLPVLESPRFAPDAVAWISEPQLPLQHIHSPLLQSPLLPCKPPASLHDMQACASTIQLSPKSAAALARMYSPTKSAVTGALYNSHSTSPADVWDSAPSEQSSQSVVLTPVKDDRMVLGSSAAASQCMAASPDQLPPRGNAGSARASTPRSKALYAAGPCSSLLLEAVEVMVAGTSDAYAALSLEPDPDSMLDISLKGYCLEPAQSMPHHERADESGLQQRAPFYKKCISSDLAADLYNSCVVTMAQHEARVQVQGEAQAGALLDALPQPRLQHQPHCQRSIHRMLSCQERSSSCTCIMDMASAGPSPKPSPGPRSLLSMRQSHSMTGGTSSVAATAAAAAAQMADSTGRIKGEDSLPPPVVLKGGRLDALLRFRWGSGQSTSSQGGSSAPSAWSYLLGSRSESSGGLFAFGGANLLLPSPAKVPSPPLRQSGSGSLASSDSLLKPSLPPSGPLSGSRLPSGSLPVVPTVTLTMPVLGLGPSTSLPPGEAALPEMGSSVAPVASARRHRSSITDNITSRLVAQLRGQSDQQTATVGSSSGGGAAGVVLPDIRTRRISSGLGLKI